MYRFDTKRISILKDSFSVKDIERSNNILSDANIFVIYEINRVVVRLILNNILISIALNKRKSIHGWLDLVVFCCAETSFQAKRYLFV